MRVAQCRNISGNSGWSIVRIKQISDKKSEHWWRNRQWTTRRLEYRLMKLMEKVPHAFVCRDRRRLETGMQQNRRYICQLSGCRCRGISVGDGCMKAGASWWKVCNCNRDKESANLFFTPGICFALKTILWDKHTSTSLRTKTINSLSRQDCLLITCTNASLSVKNKIRRLHISLPHKWILKTMG